MRIAHVSDFYLPRVGGIETHVADLVKRQRRAGYRVDVVTAAGGVADLSDRGGVIAPASPTVRLAHVRPRVIAAATDAVATGGYDVVHVHAGLVTPLAFAVAARVSAQGVPTTVTVHSLVSYLYPAYRLIDLAARWTSWPVAWTAVSRLAAQPLARLLATEAPVRVLPNAVDRDWWRIDPVPRDPAHVLVVAVMRLTPRKRPLHLLRILRQVRRDLPRRVRLSAIILGDGSERPALERYRARHAMTDWVSLPGRYTHEQIREVFRRADLFVAPANLESFGIAALEARCAGLPVVAMARGGIREFIQHGLEGVLADHDHGMAAALTALAADPLARGRIAAHNRAVAPAWGWSDVLALTDREYERAAALQGRDLSAATRTPADDRPIEAGIAV